MKVLITGGYGFIGSHTAERLHKEGYKIYVIDNLSTGDKENLKIKHKFYRMDVKDRKCEEIFANNKFDMVIHFAAQIDAAMSQKKPCFDAENNILGLINMLTLSNMYNVKRFIFTSSAAVYGDNVKIPLSEDEKCFPINPYGLSKLTGEKYCELWKNSYGLETVCLRLSNVYGPRQSIRGEGSVFSSFMNSIFNERKLLIYGDGNQTRDFIYVEDVADAVYKSMQFSISDVINISTNKQISINDLVDSLRKLHPSIEVEYTKARKGDILHSRLLNNKAVEELNWAPKYSLNEGMDRTYSWYKENLKKSKPKKMKKEKEKKPERFSSIKKILPYIENLLALVVVFLLSKFSKDYGLDIDIDFKLVYIIVIGIVYGLKQSSISVILSCLLFIWEINERGQDILSLLYNADTLIRFCLYIFVGGALGYSIDIKKHEIDNKNDEIEEIKEKFDFLYDMYDESKLVREELQNQIISTEDSFGKIYKITSSLNTLEPEKVFGATVGVIEEIMKSKDVFIFSVSKTQNYLRLISSSKESKVNVPKSLKVQDFPEIERLIYEKKIFINRDLKKSLPIMMSPIVVNDKVLALIAIYNLEFEKMSLYKGNLLKVVSNLVTSSLARAYQYDQVIFEEKYIAGTFALKRKYFEQILHSKIESREKYSTEFVLLKLHELDWKNKGIPYKVEKSIRELDYMGVNDKNELFLLLSNTKEEEAQYVMNRLKNISIELEIVKEVEYDESFDFNTHIAI